VKSGEVAAMREVCRARGWGIPSDFIQFVSELPEFIHR
jgi:hypothetical protein